MRLMGQVFQAAVFGNMVAHILDGLEYYGYE